VPRVKIDDEPVEKTLCNMSKIGSYVSVDIKNSVTGGDALTVEVQQLTVVVVPLLTLEPRRRQLSPIWLWLC
jgi:hypothetical protein